MQEYSRQSTLSTYNISQLLLKDLEEYFINDVPKLLDIDLVKSKFYSTITIYDSFGQEKLNSISEYRFPLFNDDISGITIQIRIQDYSSKKELDLELRFGKTQKKSDLSIKIKHEFAKQKVTTLHHEIFQILSVNKNLNFLIYPPEFLSALIGLSALILGLFALQETNPKTRFIYASVFFISIIYFFGFTYLKGYCQFETNRQQRFDKWFNWIVFGFLGFVLFATVLTSIRKEILGF